MAKCGSRNQITARKKRNVQKIKDTEYIKPRSRWKKQQTSGNLLLINVGVIGDILNYTLTFSMAHQPKNTFLGFRQHNNTM